MDPRLAVIVVTWIVGSSATMENRTLWNFTYDDRSFGSYRAGTDFYLITNESYHDPNNTRLSREGNYGYNSYNPHPTGPGYGSYRPPGNSYGPPPYHDGHPYNYDNYYDDYDYHDDCGGIYGMLKMGAAKLGVLGIVKGIVAAVGAGLVTKIPVLIGKLLFKIIIIPIGLLLLAAVVLIPLLLPLLIPLLLLIPVPVINIGNANRAGGEFKFKESEIARVSKMLLDSEQCLERIACEMGRFNSLKYYSAINWLFELIQRFVPATSRSRMKSYREAYETGARTNSKQKTCSSSFQCDFLALFKKRSRQTTH